MSSPTPAAIVPEPPDLAARFASTAYDAPFRRYQHLALEAFERQRAAGDNRFYLTMPPGSGKTVVGLEIARRLGRPTLVLGPTTAIQAQWLSEWQGFRPTLVEATTSPDLASPLTVLTYQAVAVLDTRTARDEGPDAQPLATGSTPSLHDRRRARILVARGGDRATVLGLLHPNGRAIVGRLGGLGPVTLVLDECHHLLELWGHVLEVVLGELHPESAVVGLTATPPTDLPEREATLYQRLFGSRADFETVTPAVVKDGYLAPYQELAYLTRPTDVEERWIARQQERFDELLGDLLDPSFATQPFASWFAVRVLERRSPDGAPVGWDVLERDDPALARAALRWQWKQGLKPPPGARYREEHRRPPEAADWIALLDAYGREVLRPSPDRYDAAALERIRRALPSVGYVLTRRGIRGATSVVDRVLGLSAAKAMAAVRILEAEHGALGDRLRALVLCDFEVAGRETTALRGVLDPGTGSAAATLREFLEAPSAARLDPVLVSGRTVACSRSTAVALVDAARRDPATAAVFEGFDPLGPPLGRAGAPAQARTGWEDVVMIAPDHPAWAPRTWVPLVTGFFERGGSRCLVGTRALLGEGWNSRTANVLIDLGAATTSVTVQQVRGRTLRLDPDDPSKVADNWDVVVVAEGHLRGSADYARFVRKHGHDFALNATGDVESGVSHVDPALGPFGPPPAATLDALTAAMLARADARANAREAWRIGEPYRDVAFDTVRIRLGRSPGLPGRRLLRAEPAARAVPGVAALAAGSLGAVGAVAAGLFVGAPIVGGAGAIAVGAVAGRAALTTARARIAALAPSDTLEDLASAVADALAATRLVAPELGAAAVRVVSQPDGYYRCFLEGASEAEANVFSEAVEQLVEPLWDPRWIIPRRVEAAPGSLSGTLGLLARRAVGRAGGAEVWHAVPTLLARRKDRVAAFETAWSRWVSPGARALPVTDPRAQAVLSAHLAEDPFKVETQIRTLWT